MALVGYKKKRKVNITPEPKGGVASKGISLFVVQEHHARNLHYDFRLEMATDFTHGEIVLKSWAVSKGMPTKKGEKRLAILVEDHPVDYINFHGVIPAGEYGAGTVEIWDKGKYEILDISRNLLKFKLMGKRLKGEYSLVKINGKFGKNAWLIIKL